MTNKLTKNDSIANEISDIEVMLSAFEAIIFRHDLWSDYFYWFQQYHLNGAIGEVFTLWKVWAKSRHPKMWSAQAFIWEGTDIAYTRWYEIDRVWTDWLNQNLNK